MAALEHNNTYSLTDDSKVYHPIKFGEDYPGYRPKSNEMPTDRPVDNDQRFCYCTNVRVWKTSQVPEERTHRVATDKVRLWLDAVQNTNPDIQVVFPPSQVEANQAIAAAKSSGKGARKRQSSVPPDSDTAKAKQARSRADETDKKAGKGKGRIPSIPKQAPASTAAALASKVNEKYTSLRPKEKRTIQSLAHDWYKAIYHTRFHMTKPEYLDLLCNNAIGIQNAKEPDPKFKEVMIKALTSLKALVNDPTTAGLPDPNQAPPIEPIGQKRPATTTASQVNPRVAKAKTGGGTYAEATIGKPKSSTPPIGAKSAPARAPAKDASGAIGAPVPPKGKAKAKAKDQGGNPPIGAASTAKQDAAKRSDPSITSDTALEFLRDAPATQSFADYQQITQAASARPEAQDAQNVQDAQTAQDEQIARAYQADLNAQGTQDAAATAPAQPANLPELDEDDDAAMQQALMLSRQQAQSQGSDPQAASSAGAMQSTDQELQHELQVGMDYQTEVQELQMKMSQGHLRPDEVARYRTVSQLWSANQARVAELCDRQVQESIAQQSRSTRAILGSLQPLNTAKSRGPALKPPPSSKDSTGACPPPASGRQSGATDLRKAPPPILGTNRPLAVKTHPQGPPSGPPKDQVLGQNPCQFKAHPRHHHPLKDLHNLTWMGRSLVQGGVHHQGLFLDLLILQGHHRLLMCRLRGVLHLKPLLTWKRNYGGKGKQSALGPRNRAMCNMMIGNNQSSTDLVITSKSINLVEILDRSVSENSSSSDTSDDDHRSPSSRGSRSRRHEHSRRHRSRSRKGSRSERRRRGSSGEKRRSRSKRKEGEHRSFKDRRRRDPSSSSQEQESEGHVEDRNKSRSSQPAQAKAAESQQMNPPPLPPPAAAPLTVPSTPMGQTQAPAARQASAQPIQRQAAQAVPATIQTAPAIGAAVAHLPMAKAVPMHQSQGHAQVAAQPDPKAIPARHSQGHVPVAQPLPQPLYPAQQQLITVQPRPQAQQLTAPPGLGTNLELTQAAHIQQMEQQLAALQAQLRATQPQAPSRPSSQSPEGWGWGDQSQDSQWHSHGWYNWGNGRGYQ